jgi:hypothetical protein
VSDKLYCPIPDLGCCDSCHEDEAYGFPLQQNDFLYCCCPTLILKNRERGFSQGAAMTYIAVCRKVALQESMALRGFARQRRLPKHVPVDYWQAWQDQLRGTLSPKYKKAA